MGAPQNGGSMIKQPIKFYDLVVSPFMETLGYCCVMLVLVSCFLKGYLLYSS